MPKDDTLYLNHILDTASKISQLLSGKTKEEFMREELLIIAITHLLQVIGEAANRVSKEFRERHPEIPISAIIGMRNKIVHDYWDIDEEIVWQTAIMDIPVLVDKLKEIV